LKKDVLLPLFSTFALVCHYEGLGRPGELEINGTQQLLFYYDDINVLGASTHTI